MPADSSLRKIVKRAAAPLLPTYVYGWLQAMVFAIDVRTGRHTEPEIKVARQAVRPGEAAIDVGANMGLYSYHLAHAVGARGLVVAFEPVSHTAGVLARVKRLLGMSNVRIRREACGETNTHDVVVIPTQSGGAAISGLAHLSGRHNERPGMEHDFAFDRASISTESVTVVRLDDVISNDIDVSLLKIDVEGAELFALRGAERLIQRCHPTIVCEVNDWLLEGYGMGRDDLVSFLGEQGYDALALRNGRLLPPDERAETRNVVFIHPSRRHRLDHLVGESAN